MLFTDDQYVVAILLLERYFFEDVAFLVFNKNQAESNCSWEIEQQCLDDYMPTLYWKVHWEHESAQVNKWTGEDPWVLRGCNWHFFKAKKMKDKTLTISSFSQNSYNFSQGKLERFLQ